MRIHTNTLTPIDLYEALAPDVTLAYWPTMHGSRTHVRAYDVQLRGRGVRHTRRPNSGTVGADAGYAATYDDHGHWMAALYAKDPDMKVAGTYANASQFHERTRFAYV